MLKKSVVLLLALVLLLPAAVLGETFDNDQYTFDYPEGWTALSRDTIDTLLDVGTELAGIDAGTLEEVKAQIEAADMIALISPSGSQVNVIAQDLGATVTASQLISMVLPSATEQLKSSLPGFEVVDPGSEVTYGDYTYATMKGSYEVLGMTMTMQQVLLSQDDVLYVITFTDNNDEIDDAMIESILGSFTVK